MSFCTKKLRSFVQQQPNYRMGNQQQFVELLNNIKEGLKHYTPEELNNALIEVLNKKSDKAPEIEHILTSVCTKFNISRRTLIHSKARGEIQQARSLAYCLLHLDLGLSVRHISFKIFKKYPNSVSVAIKYKRNCDPKIKRERIFLENYEFLQKELIEFIKEQNQING